MHNASHLTGAETVLAAVDDLKWHWWQAHGKYDLWC